MDLTEKTLESREVYRGRILRVREDRVLLPNGQEAQREIVEHPGGVGILALDADGCAVMVRQYRYAAAQPMLEVPAGKIEHDGESPDLCAARELEEEAAVTADEIIPLGYTYTSPGFCSERIYLYLARGLKKGSQHLDDDEYMNIERYTPQEVEQLIDANEITDAKTIAIFAKARKYLPGI